MLRPEHGAAENREKESQIILILVKNIADIFPKSIDPKLEPSKHLDVEVGSLLGGNDILSPFFFSFSYHI